MLYAKVYIVVAVVVNLVCVGIAISKHGESKQARAMIAEKRRLEGGK